MLRRIAVIFEMIKVQHSIFALPWAFLAAFYAALPGWPTGSQGFWILLAMVSARSAAMGFNRIVDAKFDAANPRTQSRAIPSGRVSVAFTAVFSILMAGLLALSAWRLNPLCFKLSPVALLVTWGYSYTKRFTALCHWVLGLSLAMAPIGAWLGIKPVWEPLPLLLGAAVMFWIAGADILYSCEDLEFDRRAGLHSVPAALGLRAALGLSFLCHGVTVLALLGAGFVAHRGAAYFGTVLAIAGLLAYEHALVKPDDLRRVNRAFFQVNAVVSATVLAGSLLDLALSR
jgi:4-hydroxybenzoate polyprenyltransferase